MSIEPIQWQASPKELLLKAGEVHVWLINNYAENCLDHEEQSRAAKFISPIHQERFIKAHSGLREILAKYTHQDPKAILFDKTASGKPVLKNFPNIHFNLSHSEDIALCAISNTPVGIDVEYLDKNIEYLNISKRFFSPAEIINNKLDFFKLWTQKEAYLKSQGKGLSAGLEIEIPEDFTVIHFEPIPHYLAAVGRENNLHNSGEGRSAWIFIRYFSVV